MTQCYVPADTRVDLARSLPQHNFYMAGPFSRDTNPFIFLATVPGANVTPGYFFVSYSFDFWNPVGENWQYNTAGPVPVSTTPLADNTTAVLLSEDAATHYGPGTVMVYAAGGWTVNGVPVTPDGSTMVTYYASQQSSVYAPAQIVPSNPTGYDTTTTAILDSPDGV